MDVIESNNLLSHLPEKEAQLLLQAAHELHYTGGQPIFKEGDTGDGLYLVKSGQVTIVGTANSGEQFVFFRVAPGDFFGEMAVLDKRPRSANAIAEGETVVYFIPHDAVVNLLKRSPEFGWVFLQRFSARLRDFNRQYINQLLHADRIAMVGRFASSIVHDLKTPLTIINLAASMASQANNTLADRIIARQRINDQVDRVNNMVNDLLEFARGVPTSGDFPLTDYAGFVNPLLAELHGAAQHGGVQIVLENPPPVLALPLDSRRLYRVFFNLIKNAMEAMPEGGKITLRFQVNDLAVITEIEDSGPGLAPEALNKIFVPFATFGKRQGTGLGLSICRRIIQEHGGDITAHNRPGGGAVFTFTLPRPPVA
ncbi:MAG: ATP-binding protein [Verrucomicrobiota bacterium]